VEKPGSPERGAKGPESQGDQVQASASVAGGSAPAVNETRDFESRVSIAASPKTEKVDSGNENSSRPFPEDPSSL